MNTLQRQTLFHGLKSHKNRRIYLRNRMENKIEETEKIQGILCLAFLKSQVLTRVF